MRTLISFTQLSIDGYYADRNSDMSWAHADPNDAEWNKFVGGNASGGGALLFGRVTYDMMVKWWPTDMAKQRMPQVAAGMNSARKFVASRTMDQATWENTQVLKGDLVQAVRVLKESPGEPICILGSGSVVAQLAEAGLIDEFQIVVNPVALGGGKALFGGIKDRLSLALEDSRAFKNGNVVLRYRGRSK